jgi:hypothetical protein
VEVKVKVSNCPEKPDNLTDMGVAKGEGFTLDVSVRGNIQAIQRNGIRLALLQDRSRFLAFQIKFR